MSEFLASKARTFFKHVDLNDDGYVSLPDFLQMAERHCDAEKVNDVEREKTKASFAKLWRAWMKSTEFDDNGLLAPSILAESMKLQRNDPEFKETYKAMCLQFFRALDVNGDGFLQEEEFSRSFAQVGIRDVSVIHRAFEAIDLNEDGKLSFEEFSIALVEYLTTEDEKSPYNGLWGPLVN